ncbi:MAG: SBBP repeat-containing protein [Acidobacteriia bacterium]|nr:SBBP repeat-containing protein [Terriglobia bacterium]
MRVLIGLLFTFSCLGASFDATSRPRVLAFEARNGQYVSHGPGYALSVTSGGAVLSIGGHAVHMSVAGASPKSSLEALDLMPGRANYLLGSDVRACYDLYGRVRWRGVYSGIDLVFRGDQEHLEYDFEVGSGRDPGRIELDFDGVDEIRIDRNGDLVLQVGAIRIHQPKPVAYQIVAGQKQPVEVAYRIDASSHIRFRTGAYDHQRSLVIDPQIVFDQSFGGSGVSTAAGLARDKQGGLYVAGTTNSTDFTTVNPVRSHLGTAPLLVTADAGNTWSFPSLGPANSVSAIAAAPSAPLVVYAATPVGVLKSADGGTTWTATTGTGLAGLPTVLAVDASSATTLYTATAQGVFVSTDGAESWRASTGGLPAVAVVTIVADPTQAGTLFASVVIPALFRSTDFGQTWTKLTLAPPTQPAGPVNAIVFGSNGEIVAATSQGLLISTDGGNSWTAGASQGVYNNQELAISPDNPSILYLIGSSGLQRSSDGGQTFIVVLSSVTSSYLAAVVVDPRNPANVYAAASKYPANINNVLYRSTDAGQTWSPLSLPYPVNPQSLFISPADSRAFLGAGTQNTVFVTKWSADGSQVLYSTYLGGSQKDGASGIAVDGNGSAYVTGLTSSPDFPTTKGAFQTKLTTTQDVFVAKLSPDGSQLTYSTLLGGDFVEHQCCQPTTSTGIAVDSTGNAVITGFTEGTFPVTANAFQTAPVAGCYLSQAPSMPTSGDAFVTKIAAGGNALVYSTLLGGSCATNGIGVAVDASGNAWVTGSTESPDFPVTADALQPKFGGGMYDGFLARFNPSGGLDYATYLGGSGYDALDAIALDQSGNIYLTGESGGLSQPASPGAFQPQARASCLVFFIGPSEFYPQGNALVVKLDPKAHSIQRLTYLGSPRCLSGSSIAVDSSGEAWISGTLDAYGSAPQTASPFEIGIGRGFISKFSADFTQLLFSTYFDSVAGLALDSSGSAYVAGATLNTTTVTPVFIAKIDSTPPPEISLDSVLSVVPSANPSNSQGIAAGEVIRLLGKKMGPAAATPGAIQSGVLASTVAGVEVTFDGAVVPLLSVSAQEIDLVAPFELATKSSTTIQVQYHGAQSNPVQVAVSGTALQILGVFNEDFSPNAASNPAKAGSVMSLYLAGAGQTNPPSQDGQVNAAPLAAPAMPIRLEWFGNNPITLPITFAGAASGLAAGIFQVNFIAPQQSLMNVNLIMGNAGTQFNVWVQQ